MLRVMLVDSKVEEASLQTFLSNLLKTLYNDAKSLFSKHGCHMTGKGLLHKSRDNLPCCWRLHETKSPDVLSVLDSTQEGSSNLCIEP